MKIVFAGTPEFAAQPLKALLDDGLPVTAVYTQPDRPAGRGRKLMASAVKQLALDAGLPVHQPPSLKTPEAQNALRALQPDLLIVIAYGLILPQAVLDIPRLGCVNLHASLLPRWRGAAPIQRALEAGDARTGVCLMQMDAGLDTGPVLAEAALDIQPDWHAGELHDALAQLGCAQLPRWIRQLEAGALEPRVQDDRLSCYASKLSKSEALLDWSRPADELARQVRAFNPWPVAYARLGDEHLKLWRVAAVHDEFEGRPGEIKAVDAGGLQVACGRGGVCISELQFPGGRRMRAVDAARGRNLLGLRFES